MLISIRSLIRSIRQEEQDHYLYIILLTSRSDRADVVEAFDAGVDDFLLDSLVSFPADFIGTRLHETYA